MEIGHARYVMHLELFVPFEGLDAEERHAQEQGPNQPENDAAALAELRGPHRHHHGEAAAQKHNGVGRADVDIEAATGDREDIGILGAVYAVRQKHAAEEHDFGDEEDPHAERRSVPLLRGGIELLAERKRLFFAMQLQPPRYCNRTPPASQWGSRRNYAWAAAKRSSIRDRSRPMD